LADLGFAISAGAVSTAAPASGPQARDAPLSERLVRALQGECWTADDLAELARADVARVLTALVELELAGTVTRGPGGLYRLT
jgi:predicted Rossmann fold nucleotide-binding protein DprA/Smf involved in DNA uptake